MKQLKWLFIPALASCLLSSCAGKDEAQAHSEPAPLIPLEDFFRNGVKSTFRISPDGQYFSYRADFKGYSNIFVQKVGDSIAHRVTTDTSRSIGGYFWKGDRIVYAQDIGGDENFQLFAVTPDGSNVKALTPFKGVRTEIVDDLEDIEGKEKQLIVMINKRNPEYFDPYELNIETGDLKLLYDNKDNYEGWTTDNNGVIRLVTKTDGVNITYFHRASDKEKFVAFMTTSFKEQFSPQSFDKDNKNIYAVSNIGRDKAALVTYDPVAKKEITELFANKDYDIGGAFYDRKKQVLVSASWTADKQEEYFFDKEWEAINSGIQSKLQGYEAELINWNQNRSKGIVWIGSDKLPAKYYLYDFKSGDVKEAANPFPWINESHMAEMKPISYTSRDGLTIHGYLTLPKGVDPKNLPVVINPHGGPWARDVWGYNNEAQFLANRGYAVLQMNFRGSTGYGRKFWETSFHQWGLTMQDDITDGVNWLVKEGIADPKRVAIYGGSYGGYATLAGVAFTPDLYAAAIDYVGVSNLFSFMNTIPPYWKPYLDQFHEMVGDPKKDSLLLAKTSPALHADQIKTPLFIAQGANDPRVNKAESDQMVEALKKRGIEVQYMVKDDEGHGFHNQKNQYEFYGAMEKFLAQHLAKKQTTTETH